MAEVSIIINNIKTSADKASKFINTSLILLISSDSKKIETIE